MVVIKQMMYNNPFYHFPFYRSYRPYPSYSYPQSASMHAQNICESKTQKKSKEDTLKQDVEENGQFFDILGIRLYFDDILLICLIFFLYQEGVKDQSLFISLILLLLS